MGSNHCGQKTEDGGWRGIGEAEEKEEQLVSKVLI